MQYNSTKTTLVFPTSSLSDISLPRYTNPYSFAQDLIHSRASIDWIDRLFRRSVTVNPALEKRRSGSAAIAGIESTSRAILDRCGKSFLCLGSIHHFRTSSKSWCCKSRQYRAYSSKGATGVLYRISIKGRSNAVTTYFLACFSFLQTVNWFGKVVLRLACSISWLTDLGGA